MSRIIISQLLILIVSLSVLAQKRIEKAIESGLFEKEELLPLTLTMNINKVVKDIKERDSHYALLSYVDSTGQTVQIELKLQVRGNNRANPTVCAFPPLELNFKKKDNYDNLFAGQDKIKLVTHCNKSIGYEDYVIQEYLTYKQYNILTDSSFKVRIVRMTYIDSASQEVEIERYGILIENQDVMATRQGMVIKKDSVSNQDFCSRYPLDLMAVFQFFIGNTDWSVPHKHNVKLMNFDSLSRLPVPVPYDFDYAGAVATHYSAPHESLPISSVKERLFRGYCRQPGQYEKILDSFIANKEALYDVYRTSPYIDEKELNVTLKYFDKFYKIIENPKKAKYEIIQACPVPHRHVY